MKDYINIAIRVNIALILAVEIVAAFVLPILLGILLSTNVATSASYAPILIGLFTNGIIIFIASFWVFKATYGNMLNQGKQITLLNAVLYSAIIFLIYDAFQSFYRTKGGVLFFIVNAIVALVSFYLSGKSAEKKRKKVDSATANPSPPLSAQQ